jgi:hypothetical protein
MTKKTWVVFVGLTLGFIAASWGQLILLYKTPQERKKYVFIRNIDNANKVSVSEVIISDSIELQTNSPVCQVTFSNAIILLTKEIEDYSPTATTNFVQSKFYTDVCCINLPSNTKVLFNDSLTDINHVQLNQTNIGNVVYRGEAAIQEIKKLGMNQPDYLDPNWSKD